MRQNSGGAKKLRFPKKKKKKKLIAGQRIFTITTTKPFYRYPHSHIEYRFIDILKILKEFSIYTPPKMSGKFDPEKAENFEDVSEPRRQGIVLVG